MYFSRFSAIAATLALTTVLVAGCKKDTDPSAPTTGVFSIEMENAVGDKTLTLNTDHYTTAAGDDFTVSTFKYHVSNVKLYKADNTAYSVPDTYFLVDQAKADSQLLSLTNVPAGDYTSLSFVVGVDSARTKAGKFSGALSSDNGMWWDWSQEFINLKLEGTSRQSPKGGLVFHVAGYKGAKGANNTIRSITLPFPAGTNLLIRPDHTPQIHVRADVLGLFGAPNPVRFSTVYNEMGGPQTVKMADNLAASVFSVEHIHANIGHAKPLLAAAGWLFAAQRPGGAGLRHLRLLHGHHALRQPEWLLAHAPLPDFQRLPGLGPEPAVSARRRPHCLSDLSELRQRLPAQSSG